MTPPKIKIACCCNNTLVEVFFISDMSTKRARADSAYLDFSSTSSDDERAERVMRTLGDPAPEYVYLVVECNERPDEFRWHVRGVHATADAAWDAAVAGMLAPRADGVDPAPHAGWLDDGTCFGAVCGARCPAAHIRDRAMVLRVALGAAVALGGTHPFDLEDAGADAVAASDGRMRRAQPAAPCTQRYEAP